MGDRGLLQWLNRLLAITALALIGLTIYRAFHPSFRLSILGGANEKVSEDIMTYDLANGLVISADVPEERVCEMTEAVFENLDALAGVHPPLGEMSKETVLDGFGSPLHPGALRYYREMGFPGIEDFVASTGG